MSEIVTKGNSSPAHQGDTGSSQSSQVGRFKTEAANPYLQFISDSKKKSTGVLNMKKITKEWQNKTEIEKNPFVLKYKLEKAELGSNYRLNRKRKQPKVDENRKIPEGISGSRIVKKNDNDHVIEKGREKKPKKTTKKKNLVSESVTKEPSAESNEDEEPSIRDLINKIEGKDEEIDLLSQGNSDIKNQIAMLVTELSIKRHVLADVSDSVSAFQVKCNDILAKHKSCYLADKE